MHYQVCSVVGPRPQQTPLRICYKRTTNRSNAVNRAAFALPGPSTQAILRLIGFQECSDRISKLTVANRVERLRVTFRNRITKNRAVAIFIGFTPPARKDMRMEPRVSITQDLVIDPVSVCNCQQGVSDRNHVDQK